MTDNHRRHMKMALELADRALKRNEFPVGCVMVHKGQVVARGERTGTQRSVPSELDHAEMIALRQLEELPASIERRDITLYATLEPCLMCFGALLLSGVGTIVYAYEDAMGGGTSCDRTQMPELYKNNRVRIIPDICREESLALFTAFFSNPEIDYWRGSQLADYTLAQV